MKTKLAIILSTLLFCFAASAETLKLHVFVADNLNTFTRIKRTMAAAVSEMNAQLPVKIKIADYNFFPNLPYIITNGKFELQGPYLDRIVPHIFGAREFNNDRHSIYLILVDGPRNFMNMPSFWPSAATMICGELEHRPVAIAAAIFERFIVSSQSDKVVNQIATVSTKIVIQHEILHSIGATHDEKGISVMTPGAMGYVTSKTKKLPITRRTVREVRSCMSKIF